LFQQPFNLFHFCNVSAGAAYSVTHISYSISVAITGSANALL